MSRSVNETALALGASVAVAWAWCEGRTAGIVAAHVCVFLVACACCASRWREARRKGEELRVTIVREKGYREMDTTPVAKPPRREWVVARILRHGEGDRAGQIDGFSAALALGVALVAWALLFAVSDALVPFSHNDTPPPRPADERCIRSRGVWNAGEIDGKRAEWCSWGLR